ncbi:phosphoglycerate mutase-like protein [Aureobasidium pullulans EXF-150]|uniref:Phosphoglycerate mutase-like protein n=1 Tax=Aureobasidium pullulans EXF-150 TaxID=1043002 RepID=A0A074X619_AURPU|nr:phosphoglycerate mutase-like protein [Aureobasidium pullulans EXF-150]KEQ79184.1 phosphoglycerate mutase-like protein [Aureobasidium pullulans EXF-150]
MVLETIYVTRHGFRSNWVVDPTTGTYTSNLPTPTGIASDPALAAHGVNQSKELAEHIATLDPPVDVIYSSPFYRCLQTLKPTVEKLNGSRSEDKKLQVHVENGVGEFYGLARFDHPSPATLDVLAKHFPGGLAEAYIPVIRPSVNGESLTSLHDRIAYALYHVIQKLDQDPNGPKTLLICTHAASMICIGRALTGRMPEDPSEEDFKCFTCSLSKFTRRNMPEAPVEKQHIWTLDEPENIPFVDWRGKGVKGGWDCEVNGDCSFLDKGEERGWYDISPLSFPFSSMQRLTPFFPKLPLFCTSHPRPSFTRFERGYYPQLGTGGSSPVWSTWPPKSLLQHTVPAVATLSKLQAHTSGQLPQRHSA